MISRRLFLSTIGASALAATTLSSCSSGSSSADKIVIYTPNEQGMLDALIPEFEKEASLDTDIVTAGTGELYQRIRSEASSPQGDVMFGGSAAQAGENKDLWEPYTSSNNDAMLDLGKNIGGFCSPYQADGSNLLVNTSYAGASKVTSYESLLDPALKGRIAFGDPTQSSSAFAQLTNMLLAMGGYEDDKAWDYVGNLVKQLDGKTIGSSTQVAQDTANGEFDVALTYEPLSVNFVKSGADVEIVYPSEGAVFLPAGLQIIKGAPHMDGAKKFVDFMTSEKGQKLLAENTTGRPLRDGVDSPNLKKLSEIKTLDEDTDYVSEHRDDIIARYKKLLEGN